MIQLSRDSKALQGNLYLPGSKSESNRWLILQALYPEIIDIQNLSTARDCKIMQHALQKNQGEINILDAGTAARFLTAFFAQQIGSEVRLLGTSRMHQRPIKPLVDALNDLGADIRYENQHGYLPLCIKGQKLEGKEVEIAGDISSQFITALALISAKMPNGLKIKFSTPITSKPYIDLTVAQLQSIGIKCHFTDNYLQIQPQSSLSHPQIIKVESDWSSASYLCAMAALAPELDLTLKYYQSDSAQGDSAFLTYLNKITDLKYNFENQSLKIFRPAPCQNFQKPNHLVANLNHTPDIAQTLCVLCTALQIPFHFSGLHTLAYKETHRLQALQSELKKIGAITAITEDSIQLVDFTQAQKIPQIQTYEDHRMAMSFAIWAMIAPIQIKDPQCVQKSYPGFWTDLQQLHMNIQVIE